MKISLRPFLLTAGILLLAGCHLHPYTVTFNDNVVYQPNASATNSVLKDPALQACLNGVLTADEAIKPETLTLLACPGSGVMSLDGIEKLEKLEQLEVSDNAITDINPLNRLPNLRVLGIRNNRLTDISALEELGILRFVSLLGNNNLPCTQISALQAKLGNTLQAPTSCRN